MHAYLNRRERRMALRIESRRQTRARRIERPKAAPMIIGAEVVLRPWSSFSTN